jgi:hypothetical protein
MTYDDVIHKPTYDSQGVRKLCNVDYQRLLNELGPLIDTMGPDKKQVGLRWADDFEGVGDLRDKDYNPKGYGTSDFKVWQPHTEYLQEVANSIGIREYGRVRLLLMSPQTCYTFHYDLDGHRVHIPLWTHNNSLFFVHGKMWHMELGYAYLMDVSKLHTAINAGRENRLHIVFDKCEHLA